LPDNLLVSSAAAALPCPQELSSRKKRKNALTFSPISGFLTQELALSSTKWRRTMKTLFGMAAAVLLVVTMLVVSLPENAAAAEKVTLTEMVKIKKAADEAVQAAKAQKEKAKTVAERRIAKDLLKQAEINAEVAGELLEAVKAGEEVSREEADACAAIAEAVHEAAAALAAGDTGKGRSCAVQHCGAWGQIADSGKCKGGDERS
jgi:hypothetical protein